MTICIAWASGGVPSYIVASSEHTISPGTYNCYHTLRWFDGSFYEYSPGWYIGYPYDSSYYWKSTYSVEADKGSFPFVDGKNHYFNFYLSWYGLYKGVDVRYIETPAQHSKSMKPQLGT